MFCLFWYKTKPTVFILGKLSKYFLSFVFMTQLQPKTCCVFRERYMNNRSRNSHGKQFNLSNAKFRAVDSKPTLFIAKFRWNFVSKRKFDEIVLFVQRKIRSKSLELSFELSHEISKKVRENCIYIYIYIYLFIYLFIYLWFQFSPGDVKFPFLWWL